MEMSDDYHSASGNITQFFICWAVRSQRDSNRLDYTQGMTRGVTFPPIMCDKQDITK